MTSEENRPISERLAVVETKVDLIQKEVKAFHGETRTALDGVNSRLLAFALSVAASGIAVAATVFFTR